MANPNPINTGEEDLNDGIVPHTSGDSGGGTFILDGNILQSRPKGWKGSRARRVLSRQPLDFLPDTAIGLKLPFNNPEGRLFDLNYLSMDQTMTNLKNLLLTRKGERIMHPKFGTRLQEALFEPNDQKVRDYIQTEVERAITFWMPYVMLQAIDVNTATKSGSSQAMADSAQGIIVTIIFSLKNNRIDTRQIVLDIKAD